MTFFVTLIAWLIERFFDWSHLRHWQWYAAYQHKVANRFLGKAPYLILGITVIPLMFLIVVIQFILSDWLYGVAKLVFELIVLIYCLGPKDLWADTFACINAITQGDAKGAAEKLQTSFGGTESNYSQSLHWHLLSHIFTEANRRVFAVTFWYVVLGPAGAFLYRAVTCSAFGVTKEEANSEMTQSARKVESLLDWVPVRVFTFLFALGGHFAKVLTCWRKKALLGLDSSEAMLTECGMAALGGEEEGKVVEDGSVEKSAISLLDRVFVIALVLIAVVALVV